MKTRDFEDIKLEYYPIFYCIFGKQGLLEFNEFLKRIEEYIDNNNDLTDIKRSIEKFCEYYSRYAEREFQKLKNELLQIVNRPSKSVRV